MVRHPPMVISRSQETHDGLVLGGVFFAFFAWSTDVIHGLPKINRLFNFFLPGFPTIFGGFV